MVTRIFHASSLKKIKISIFIVTCSLLWILWDTKPLEHFKILRIPFHYRGKTLLLKLHRPLFILYMFNWPRGITLTKEGSAS
jgi:hypothetical protein